MRIVPINEVWAELRLQILSGSVEPCAEHKFLRGGGYGYGSRYRVRYPDGEGCGVGGSPYGQPVGVPGGAAGYGREDVP